MSRSITVTDIKRQQKRRNRVSLLLDGKFAIGVSISVIEKAGIHVGQHLSQSEVENLRKEEENQHAMDRALRYLSPRPRSEFEVKNRLRRYGYDDSIIATTLDRLRKAGYIDDAAFATFWRENRSNFSSRSTRMVAQELKQKGIDPEIIAATTENVDDEIEAYRAGYKKAHSLNNTDYYEFRRKLGAFLHRRGFDYEIIGHVVEQLWETKLCEDRNGY